MRGSPSGLQPGFCPATWRKQYDISVALVNSIADFSKEEWARPLVPIANTRRQILAGALLTIASPLWAQDGVARIRVLDRTGDVVPGTVVTLLDTDQGEKATQRVNAGGEVTFTGLPMGNHRFKAQHLGFETLVFTASPEGLKQIDVVLRVNITNAILFNVEPDVRKPSDPNPSAPPRKVPKKRRRWLLF